MEFRYRRAASLIHSGKEWETNTRSRSEMPVWTVSQKSVIFSGGDSSNNYGADQQRLQISDLHFDKFPTPATFACWKIRFKTEVCTCSQVSYGSYGLDQRSGDGWLSGWFKIFVLCKRNSNAKILKNSMRGLIQHWTESSIILTSKEESVWRNKRPKKRTVFWMHPPMSRLRRELMFPRMDTFALIANISAKATANRWFQATNKWRKFQPCFSVVLHLLTSMGMQMGRWLRRWAACCTGTTLTRRPDKVQASMETRRQWMPRMLVAEKHGYDDGGRENWWGIPCLTNTCNELSRPTELWTTQDLPQVRRLKGAVRLSRFRALFFFFFLKKGFFLLFLKKKKLFFEFFLVFFNCFSFHFFCVFAFFFFFDLFVFFFQLFFPFFFLLFFSFSFFFSCAYVRENEMKRKQALRASRSVATPTKVLELVKLILRPYRSQQSCWNTRILGNRQTKNFGHAQNSKDSWDTLQ